MGLFDWLKGVFGGRPQQVPPVIRPAPSGSVPPVIGSAPRASAPTPPSLPRKSPPASKELKLDLGQFAPLSDAEAKKKARGLGTIWGNPWFGRRDLIPPLTDARTEIIDRAMVGHGFITPEELVEIHKVGEQMDQIRPDLALAREMADTSVAKSEEEKALLKKRKKEEAAARKKQHAEQVLQRKQTDIVFLGRNVSGGLADRRANIERLQSLQLPVLASPADVAQALGLTIPQLRWLAFHSEAATTIHYVRFQVPKKSGGTRELSAPHRHLSQCQKWILAHILEKIPVSPQAHGFVPGRSTMSNAVPHVGREVVVNLDLKNFFPTITFPRVKGLFQNLGYSPAAATILALLCTEAPRRKVEMDGKVYHVATGPRGLPQGACTSPALSNLVARKLDSRLQGLATKLGLTYTRYADDLTFSGSKEAGQKAGYLLARVRHIAAEENFVVNEAKTRVQRPNMAQTVTGIVVNQQPNVRRKTRRQMRAILHRAKTEGLARQNRIGRPFYECWVQGMIAYISMVNPQTGKKLREQFEKVV